MSENEVKQRILQTVQDMLAEGCSGEEITVRKIAQRAGVGIGTVSYHYHSKDKLVYEAVAAQMTGLTTTLAPGEGEGTPRERLLAFLRQTAELALPYSKLFQIQLSYEMVHGDMSICYYLTPLLKEHFGASKNDLQIKMAALQIIATLQSILLKMDAFQRYAGVDVRHAPQREEALDVLLDGVLQK